MCSVGIPGLQAGEDVNVLPSPIACSLLVESLLSYRGPKRVSGQQSRLNHAASIH